MKCNICGSHADFICNNNSLRESICPACGSSQRQSDLARVILDTFLPGTNVSLNEGAKKLCNLMIFEAQATGPIHAALQGLPNYFCSEYFDDIPGGQKNADGILCQDLQNLAFPSDHFDLVITQDVFEHIREPWKAFREISRVLKPGGFHIFTVPYHEGRLTSGRIVIDGDKDITIYPPVYHDDSLREKGAVVYTDFGSDLSSILNTYGFATENIPCGIWYSRSEIPKITNENEYQEYFRNYHDKKLLEFLKYNSWVFRSKKNKIIGEEPGMLEWTGERYLPFIDPALSGAEIHYEHLHRYAFAAQFVKGKKVLDLACGEGYGSYLCAKYAKEVVGIDIDPVTIHHASNTYVLDNLEYIQGSILDIPLCQENRFDVVTCFEAIEHVNEQDILLSEIKRLLAKNGILIISTPNAAISSKSPGSKNPFHKKELDYREFESLLKKYFNQITIFGQRLLNGSTIYPANPENKGSCSEFFVDNTGNRISYSDIALAEDPAYLIAIASDSDLQQAWLHNSYLIDKSNTELSLLNLRITNDGITIQSLQQTGIENNQKITQLSEENTELSEKNAELSEKFSNSEKNITLYAAEVERLNSVNQELNAHIRAMNTRCNLLVVENQELKQSTVYCLTQKIDKKIINPLFPQDSTRRKYYSLMIKAGRILVNEGFGELLWHYRERSKHLRMMKIQYIPVIPRKVIIPSPLPADITIDTKVSIVIPTKNAGSDFRYTLEKIREQKGVSDIEIIVVDSGSRDMTLEIARNNRVSIISIPPEEFNHGKTRNLGASHASGEYIVFIVQDAIPAGDFWLHDLVDTIRKENLVAVSCRQIPKSDADLFSSSSIWNHYETLNLTEDQIFSLKGNFSDYSFLEKRRMANLDDVCSMIRKDIFDKFQFDTREYGEDLDLGKRLVMGGHRTAFLNSAAIIHSHNRDAGYFLKRGYVDNKNVFRILNHPPQTDPSVSEVRDLYSATATMYAALTASIRSIRTQSDSLNVKSVESIRLNLIVNLENPSILSEYQNGCGSLDIFFGKMQDLFGSPSYRTSEVLKNMLLNILDDFTRYLQGIRYQGEANDDFFDSIYKSFATVAGALLAQYYLKALQTNTISEDLIKLDKLLREGI